MGINIKRVIVGEIQTNCYIVYDDEQKKAVIVDPGDNSSRIIDIVSRLGLKPELILLTHGHFDHTLAADIIREEFNIPIYISQEDFNMIEKNHRIFPQIGKDNRIDYFIKDGDIIVTSTFKMRCISTPGHTPGGMCFLVNDNLLAGDTLFYRGMGRSDLEGGDLQTLVNSIKDKLFVLDSEIKVLPGHGPETTIGHEKSSFVY
ncbi:MBL fold metallo-hydrolase [Clostridium sp. DL1XJH146]